MCAAAVKMQVHLSALLQDVQLSCHSAHTASQTGQRFAILAHFLTGKQLLKLVQPVLFVQLLTDEQLVEAAQDIPVVPLLTGKQVLEVAHGVDLAWGQVRGRMIRGAGGKAVRAAARSPGGNNSSCGREGDVISRAGGSFGSKVVSKVVSRK